MSKISTVHAAILSRIATLLPSRTRLINPYRVESNPDGIYQSGYGIAMNAAEATKRSLGGKVWIRRDFTVVLTSKFHKLDLDATASATAELALFEDQLLLIKDFETNTTVNGVAIKVEYQQDTGILFREATKDNFLYVETLFFVEYSEDL